MIKLYKKMFFLNIRKNLCLYSTNFERIDPLASNLIQGNLLVSRTTGKLSN